LILVPANSAAAPKSAISSPIHGSFMVTWEPKLVRLGNGEVPESKL
jgi:hypothetical protein